MFGNNEFWLQSIQNVKKKKKLWSISMEIPWPYSAYFTTKKMFLKWLFICYSSPGTQKGQEEAAGRGWQLQCVLHV